MLIFLSKVYIINLMFLCLVKLGRNLVSETSGFSRLILVDEFSS